MSGKAGMGELAYDGDAGLEQPDPRPDGARRRLSSRLSPYLSSVVCDGLVLSSGRAQVVVF